MALRNDKRHWGSVSKTLHWGMALLILVLIVLGILAVNWPLSPTKLKLFSWHKSIGMLVLALALLRITWRLVCPPPQVETDGPAWRQRAARGVHWLLYLLMIGMPLSGWLINSAANFPFRIFGWLPLPALVAPDKALQTQAETLHLTLLIFLLLLLAAHVSAALYHHLVLRDRVLADMLPATGGKE